jgi:excisionase family DNA binding protein
MTKTNSLMSPDELAKWLYCSRKAIYHRVQRGQLPGVVRLGRRLYFRRSTVLNFVRQQERRARPSLEE